MAMKIGKKWELTIPKAIRDKLGLVPGTLVDFAFNQRGELVIKKAEAATETNL